MRIVDYASLKDAIELELVHDAIAEPVDLFIQLAEEQHATDVRIREMIERSQAALSSRYLALPPRFAKMEVLRLLTPMAAVRLEPVSLDRMTALRRETTGRPRFFSVHEEIEFDVAPDQAYTVEQVYYARFEPLSDTNTTNALLTRAPGVYLYGALTHTAPFLQDDARLSLWTSLYTTLVEGLNLTAKNARHPGPLASRVAGPTP